MVYTETQKQSIKNWRLKNKDNIINYTPAQKKAIMNWRSKNKEKVNTYALQFYYNNAEERKKQRMNYYYLQKEMKIFRNILIEDI